MKKRFLAVFVAFIVAFCSLYFPEVQRNHASAASRAADKGVEQENELTDLQNDISVKGTGSFGNMLADELSIKAEGQKKSNGCNIFSIEMENGTADVSFETAKDATLVVGIFDEKGVSMLMSASTDVKTGQMEASLTIKGSIPQYFYIKGFLIDSDTMQPLCTSYGSPMYTKEMQDFLSKTTSDFEEERVLNLDSDKTNNFAVYSDETILIPQKDGANEVVSADDDKLTYVIENANEDIASLKKGDTFAYEYKENETLIVKVASIKTKGTKVTITGEDTSMEDVFDYVKIDEDAGLKGADIDPSACGEGVVYNGLVDYDEDAGSAYEAGTKSGMSQKKTLYAMVDESKSSSMAMSYNFANVKTGSDEANAKLSGGVTMQLTASVKVYISMSYQYFEMKLESSAKINISLSAKISAEIPLAYVGFSPVPGVFIELTPKFVIDVTGKVEASGTLKAAVGFSVSSKEGLKNLTSSPTFKPELKAEVTIFVGFRLIPKVKVLSDSVIQAQLSATAGVDIKLAPASKKPSSSKVHACMVCFDGSLSGKAGIKVKASILNLDKLTFERSWTIKSNKAQDLYYSIDYGESGLSKCPHCYYKIGVTVLGEGNKGIEGAKIESDFKASRDGKARAVNYASELKNMKFIMTGNDGQAVGYLPDGRYKFTVSADGYEKVEKWVDVKGSSKEIRLALKAEPNSGDDSIGGNDKDSGDDSKGEPEDDSDDGSIGEPVSNAKYAKLALGKGHSGVITKDGSLYMWGCNEDGELGDGTTKSKSTPVKVLDNVVSVSLGYHHSGAITKDGSLYMWGYNGSGQLGDGTTENQNKPVKVLDNVASISLGWLHSGAVTKDGSLYMWGSNSSGQLGDGTKTYKNKPVKVLDNVALVSLGDEHSGAVTKDGSLYMWGDNARGQLGDGTKNSRNTPAKVMGGVALVSLGDGHSGAVKKDGSLYMWGGNFCGKLGNGTEKDSEKPIKVMDNVKSISLRSAQSGAVKKNGNLYMWGDNSKGELGDGTKKNRSKPVKVLENVKSFSLGWLHSGAITEDGSLYMWGSNEDGELGDGTTDDRKAPAKTKLSQKAAVARLSSAENILKSEAILKGASLSEDKVKVSGSMQTAEFSHLIPNETYNFYLLKSQSDGQTLDGDDFLYINQYVADSSGSLSFTYQAKESCDSAVQLLVGKSKLSLAKADVSIPNLNYTGKVQYAVPTVTYEGKVLEEGKDYEVADGGSAKEAGSYILTITGIGIYNGKAVETYQVIAKKLKKGDVVVDGSSNSVYRITSATAKRRTVTLVKPQSRKIKDIKIPAAVWINGAAYKVTSIADGAFKNCVQLKGAVIGSNITKIGKQSFQGCKKLSSIKVKTTKLSSIKKNALKGINPNAKIKVPSQKLAAYKKLFMGKGQGKKVKIIK